MMLRITTILIFFLTASACQNLEKKGDGIQHMLSTEPTKTLPFEFLQNTFVVVDVSVEDTGSHRFLLDTGAGFDAISKSLCKKLSCETSGKLTGKRMRGDQTTLDLTKIKSLEFASIKKNSWEVGVTNLFDEIPPELGKLEGALSLRFFAEQPVTIDFHKRKLVIESPGSLEKRVKHGRVVEAKLYSQLPKTLGLFLSIDAFGKQGSFEVDTGNLTTIIPQSHLKRLKVDLRSQNTKVIKNAQMNRVYALVNGKIAVRDIPDVNQVNPQICFEDIIYDGVIGVDFFKDKVVTFDIPNSRLIFSK